MISEGLAQGPLVQLLLDLWKSKASVMLGKGAGGSCLLMAGGMHREEEEQADISSKQPPPCQ